MSLENSNQVLNKSINQCVNASSNLTGIMSEKACKLAYDIEQVEDYDNIDEFLNFIKDNKLSIFTPNENYFTIFHILIQGARIPDFNKISDYVKENLNAYKNIDEFNYLKEALKFAMKNDEYELDHEAITTVYSNLKKKVVLDGFFDEVEDKEIIENIEFISNHLRQIVTDILNSLLKEKSID